ncbi:large conductance mechanosensitive channel protein MscL [Hominifimenecus sp. rT4P-3]|uniref:large conductance mechanosensitive channel protein MscL n=1 Tax=Hominifimenecus sp. rT4P-3 TaxID=3242979 RepID=UPI003DA68CD1
MKSFMKEFKEFIAKGNVMSMAVGIIIGSAFTAIVTSLNQDIITPLLGLILGQVDFTSLSITVGEASVLYGNFIQALITFLITAFTLFLILKAFNRFAEKKEAAEKQQPAEPAPVPEDIQLLTEIRDLLKKGEKE